MKHTLVLATVLWLAGCVHEGSNPRKTPVIIVNGETLSAAEFGKSLAKKLKNFDALAAKDNINIRRAKETVVREFIISALLRQHAKDKNLSVSQNELNEEFDRIRKTYPDDLTFKAALASEGVSIEDWKSHLADSLLEKKVFSLFKDEASSRNLEEDAKKYYETHKNEFQKPAQIHLQQIIVPKEDEADRLLRKLRGGGNFAELAKKFSISPDGAKGGDVGYIAKGEVPAFDVAFNLREGQISGVVKSSYGFHIMKVLGKKGAAKLSFPEARPRIMTQLRADQQQDSFKHWLEGAVKSAKIERNDLLIEKVKVHTEGSQE